MKCFGIAGWKNSGKTTLVAGLIEIFTQRGLVVSTLKHAHHSFDLDQPGTDSHRHRTAGARETALVSRDRWAIQHELKGEDEPALEEILARLSPCDLVLIEGYKRQPIAKLEIIGPDQISDRHLWRDDRDVVAIACDQAIAKCPLPAFQRNETARIADFIQNQLQLEAGND